MKLANAVLLLELVCLAGAEVQKWIVFSSFANKKVFAVPAPQSSAAEPDAEEAGKGMIELAADFSEPVGVAIGGVARGQPVLYVADVGKKTILAFDINVASDSISLTKPERVVVRNQPARWLAVDRWDNLFYTNEETNTVMKVDSKTLRAGKQESVKVYDQTTKLVNVPGGIAVDNYYVYWGNKVDGQVHGSVIKGFEDPPADAGPSSAAMLAKNSLSTVGVCAAASNIFFTNPGAGHVYGIKKAGGDVAVVTSRASSPKGCGWDGDGTMFLADEAGDAIFSFPANQQVIAPMHHVTHVAQLEAGTGPTGLVVFTAYGNAGGFAVLASFALAMLSWQ
mmetsp:Transcript_39216/g.94274  ORF Transcript_39216/g.94274 Transcript_39216/m.94274 type:complete len:337 (-) Transcript_39216:116-1126(-)